ncbi:MAG: DNA polymerase/3'-5' exonuclease PolX [Acidobacteria bacterium]|nr:DNA polymerase/3'-5' exonuclease PolX [Acidobacteriota bacterium]
MENAEYARLLSETADLMEIAAEDGFRIRSYRNAASAIEGYPERVHDILANPERQVTEIPGVGKGLAFVLHEIRERGSFERRDEMLARYPPTALEMLKIQGLGPKSIAAIIEHYRVSTIDGLERLCREQKLRELPRMGAKLEEKVLRSIASYRQSAGRFLLSFTSEVAVEISEYLAALPGVERVEPAGSVRRGKETAGDLDLLVLASDPQPVLDHFVKFPRISEILVKGENKCSAKVGLEGLQVDVRVLPRESYGAAMQYFTGSKVHNVALRTRALKFGLSLNEYGLFRTSDNERVAGETEEEIYGKLGLDWVAPELRENQGEIEAALEHRLPNLLDLKSIRGDLHMHTRETDGRATLEEMAETAIGRGYEYIAITDHSKALAMANGLDEARVVAFANQVRELNKEGRLGIRIFSGLECDIRRDGTMDIEWDALAELDLVIASVHSHMNLESNEMTDRLLKALECPHVRILGHPTGRILLHREGYPYDFERVAAEAAKRGVVFEINASPERLDLHASLIRAAKAKGCRFTIATDAHHPRHLANMPFGVRTARRGWLEDRDVLNTLPSDEFISALRGH